MAWHLFKKCCIVYIVLAGWADLGFHPPILFSYFVRRIWDFLSQYYDYFNENRRVLFSRIWFGFLHTHQCNAKECLPLQLLLFLHFLRKWEPQRPLSQTWFVRWDVTKHRPSFHLGTRRSVICVADLILQGAIEGWWIAYFPTNPLCFKTHNKWVNQFFFSQYFFSFSKQRSCT